MRQTVRDNYILYNTRLMRRTVRKTTYITRLMRWTVRDNYIYYQADETNVQR